MIASSLRARIIYLLLLVVRQQEMHRVSCGHILLLYFAIYCFCCRKERVDEKKGTVLRNLVDSVRWLR